MGRFVADAVHVLRLLAFLGEVERVGRRQLHAGGQFVAGDAGVEIGLAGTLLQVDAVEPGQQVALHPHNLGRPLDVGLQVENG